MSENIVKIHHTSLITVNQHPFTFIILTSDTYTVCINFFSQIHSHRKSFGIFRVRRDDSREVTVLNHLFGNSKHIFKSPHLQSTRNQHHTCTVNRSINNLHVFVAGDCFRINRNCLHHVQINFVYIFTDNLNQIRIALEFDISSRGNSVYFVLRVVRSSQDDTALATEVTDSKRHFGSRTHIVEQIYFDTVGRENIGRGLRKQTAVVTAVMTNHNRNLRQIFKVLLQIIRKTLCSGTYRIDVHTVATYAHDTA